MKQHDFFQAVDQRLRENKHLRVGGLPGWLKPGGSLLGLKTPQVLSMASLMGALLLFKLLPSFVAFVNTVLFGWWL